MKKIIITLILLSGALFAQDLTGYRLYVNPGHGGYDADDRNIVETGFWESVSNLDKGLYLYDMLVDLGATVAISRTTNTSADDLPLSTIGALANQFNADYFHSIHSNAHNKQTNYTLVLYRGYDDSPVYPQAKTMAQIVWQNLQDVNRGHWTYSYINARGDWTFYGSTSGLGVLRTLTMPGTLSEGSFHDYIPESWRLMSMGYKKHEAFAIARSFLEYFNKPDYQTGIVAGILRDPDLGVSYYAIPATNDPKKPINNATVTLTPGDRVYQVDDKNNGFFIFDSLAPGNYTITVESPDYEVYTTTVTATAGQSVFADAFLTFDTTIPPYVLSSVPADDSTNFPTISPVTVKFSREMDETSTLAAFSITPATEGTLEFGNDQKSITFTADAPLEVNTEYTINIAATAKSTYGYEMENAYSSSFTTGSRNQLVISKNYPQEDATDVSTLLQVYLDFDAKILQSSLANRIGLYDWNDNRLALKNIEIVHGDSISYIRFEPSEELAQNSAYKVELNAGIEDMSGYKMLEDFVVNFTTTGIQYLNGNMVDEFDSAENFTDPVENNSSVNLDPNETELKTNSIKKVSGERSVQVEYGFTAETGELYLSYTNPAVIGNNTNTFGIWVFGDYSNSLLKYEFVVNGSSQVVVVDTLNFAGWKMEQINLSQVSTGDPVSFKSIVIEKTAESNTTGTLFFDAAQTDAQVTAVEEDNLSPDSYKLFQNHPNPFNPSTLIKYQLKDNSNVQVKIFDVLGREVSTLVDTYQKAGTYEVHFNASGLSSGIYFYVINTENFVQTKKMMLLK